MSKCSKDCTLCPTDGNGEQEHEEKEHQTAWLADEGTHRLEYSNESKRQ